MMDIFLYCWFLIISTACLIQGWDIKPDTVEHVIGIIAISVSLTLLTKILTFMLMRDIYQIG